MSKDYAGLAFFGLEGENEDASGGDWHITHPNKSWILENASALRKARTNPKQIVQEDSAIEAEILASKFILDIEDPDDPDFTPSTVETHSRAATFLRRLALHAHSCGFSGIGVPQIVPADRGSIDLLWRTPTKQLLINFSSDPSVRASYHGRKAGSETSGRFDPSEARSELVFWLTA